MTLGYSSKMECKGMLLGCTVGFPKYTDPIRSQMTILLHDTTNDSELS